MYNRQAIYKYLIAELVTKSIKHDIHTFPSGAIMIDIWYHSVFYVVQIEGNHIDFSEITDEDPGFTTMPDIVFFSNEEFEAKLQSVLK